MIGTIENVFTEILNFEFFSDITPRITFNKLLRYLKLSCFELKLRSGRGLSSE